MPDTTNTGQSRNDERSAAALEMLIIFPLPDLLGAFCCIRCRAELHSLGEKQCACAWCPVCKAMTEVADQGMSPGFGAGSVYWWRFRCGHFGMDDQSYLET